MTMMGVCDVWTASFLNVHIRETHTRTMTFSKRVSPEDIHGFVPLYLFTDTDGNYAVTPWETSEDSSLSLLR